MADKAKSELGALRAEYKTLAGKGPSPRLNAGALLAKIDEMKAAAANPNAAPPANNQPVPPAKAPRLVKMKRDKDAHPHGPHEADVHPDEVANFASGGWEAA